MKNKYSNISSLKEIVKIKMDSFMKQDFIDAAYARDREKFLLKRIKKMKKLLNE